MADGMSEGVGVRIARERKRRGLTQQGLADRSRYSRSQIAGVESGRKIATPAFVAAVAAALGLDPSIVYGQPYRGGGRHDGVHSSVIRLRSVLAYVEVGPELGGPPRTLDQLAAAVEELMRLTDDARFGRQGDLLPAVIEELLYWGTRPSRRVRGAC